MTAQLADEAARTQIRTALDRTLFVEAGAGSGKTGSLVARVVALVLADDVPLHEIAAVTFTEKAAAELRDRLRAAFERAARTTADNAERTRAEQALDDLDASAIGTLHSFAQRILGEHPIEAGLPPLLEIADEVSSQVSFEQRWTELRAQMLDDPALRSTLLLALSSGVQLEHLRSIAHAFNAEWDRLGAAVLAAGPPPAPRLDLTELGAAAQAVCALQEHCSDGNDRMLGNLHALTTWAERLQAAQDDPARAEVLAEASKLPSSYGKKGAWGGDVDSIRTQLRGVIAMAVAVHKRVHDTVLRRLAHRIAVATVDGARARQREGALEFHDLLVLARELVTSERHGREVRSALHSRYTRLLLDEFQDTDPIQIELAVRIAGGADADAADWRDVRVPEGRLFVVGDPKQSIYRFRRADIATYLQAQEHVGTTLELTTNFRTTPTVLRWINGVFDELIQHSPGSQPPYRSLDEARSDAQGGTRMVLLGTDAHPDMYKADDVREQEADDVGSIIRVALAERWQVWDKRLKKWRDVELDDIAVLVPARTSLPQLEESLDRAGVPFRAEASSLVYRTPEVRDLLMTARAIDDPSDGLALVAALRSPLFGCGDDDLWTWKRDGGTFHLLAPAHEDVAVDHPVHLAVDYLRRLQRRSRWDAPSQVLDRIVHDRRMLETGATGPRARDVWRRLRFVVDQARAWSEAQAGGLRDYLDWAYRQGDESARVAEAVLPETDARSVRVLTVHAAKGLEFPVVIVSGLSSMPGGRRSGVEVLWPRDGGYELALSKDLQTDEFELAKPIDEQMGHHERLRLLYVACTRARDHLVVSLHRATRKKPVEDETRLTSAELLAGPALRLHAERFVRPEQQDAPSLTQDDTVAPPTYEAWLERVSPAREASQHRWAVSASSLEGSLSDVDLDPGLAKAARDLELPPWNKGRYGTAIGRAVHGVLQTVDLRDGTGLLEAVAAQCLAEGVVPYEQVVRQLCDAALASQIVQRAAQRRYWRETYVGTTLDDGTLLEGYIDLVYEDDDGTLVVVDYKTDAVPGAALAARVKTYLPQMAAYADALARATGRTVGQAVLVFLSPASATEQALSAASLSASPTGIDATGAGISSRRPSGRVDDL